MGGGRSSAAAFIPIPMQDNAQCVTTGYFTNSIIFRIRTEWHMYNVGLHVWKKNLQYSRHNFIKYWPILEILLLLQSAENL